MLEFPFCFFLSSFSSSVSFLCPSVEKPKTNHSEHINIAKPSQSLLKLLFGNVARRQAFNLLWIFVCIPLPSKFVECDKKKRMVVYSFWIHAIDWVARRNLRRD